jgi:hypothetical protein
VTFANYGDWLASSRLRAKIPQEELAKQGIEKGFDVLVYGKHLLTFEHTKKFKYKVFDICDDHFDKPELRDYYLAHVDAADAVTVNSDVMREIVLRETGRDSTVIKDPYESPERPPGIGEGLFWFGHPSNLKTLDAYDDLNIKKLTGDEWSRQRQLDELEACAFVVLPTDHRRAKSANRLIEAARNGRFVIAGPLPAYDEFKPYMWIGDIREGIEWANNNHVECLRRIQDCQDYICDKFSPYLIAMQWLSVLEKLN